MRRGSRAARALPDVLGVLWVVAAVFAVLAPALRPGVSLGPFDLLSRVGLTRQPGLAVHDLFPSDQVLQGLPWINLAWHQVHQGHLPLWNPYNIEGLPLAFNWQSAVFSLPMAVAYLFPLHLAYTVVILAKLVIAGTGAYFLCRVLGLHPLSAAFAGTAFELSGNMLHYSGWAMTGVSAWAGWILAAVLLLQRPDHRLRHASLLAVCVALAIYGGHPETLAVMTVCLAVFVVVQLALRRRREGVSPWGTLGTTVGATVAGLALSAPLLLPGVQIDDGSIRNLASGAPPFPTAHIADFLVQLQGRNFRLPPTYLGAIPVALAVVAAVMFWRRRSEVAALATMAVICVLFAYQTPFYDLFQAFPKVGLITLNRAVMLLALALAVLAAFAVDAIVRGGNDLPAVASWGVKAMGVAAVLIAVVGMGVATGIYKVSSVTARSFMWPCIDVVAGFAALWWLAHAVRAQNGRGRRHRLGSATALLVVQSVFLVASGVSFWSLSSNYFAPTPDVSALQRQVGQALVSAGGCRPSPWAHPEVTDLGIRPDANIAFEVSEFDVYDATMPAAYFHSWHAVSGVHFPRSLIRVGLFCPTITDAQEARVYGIGYVLVAPGQPGPSGTTFVTDVGDEQLFSVPGTAQATVSPLPPPGTPLATDAPGAAVPVTHPDASTWRMTVTSATPQVLRLRLTDVPGWQGTVDGHPLRLRGWASHAMLEATIPAGHHVIELHYGPALFTGGVWIAAVVAAAMAAALAAAALTRLRRARGGR